MIVDRRYHVSSAALHVGQAVDHLLMQGNISAEGWANPAYRSEEMEAKLRARGEHAFGAQTKDICGTLLRAIDVVRGKAKIGVVCVG